MIASRIVTNIAPSVLVLLFLAMVAQAQELAGSLYDNKGKYIGGFTASEAGVKVNLTEFKAAGGKIPAGEINVAVATGVEGTIECVKLTLAADDPTAQATQTFAKLGNVIGSRVGVWTTCPKTYADPNSFGLGWAGYANNSAAITDVADVPDALVAKMRSLNASGITGSIILKNAAAGQVSIDLDLSGAKPNEAFSLHIHTNGDFTPGIVGGGHYNPDNKTHGCPADGGERHRGDAGTVKADATGKLKTTVSVAMPKGLAELVGRSVVLHQGEDPCEKFGQAGATFGPKVTIGLLARPDGQVRITCNNGNGNGNGKQRRMRRRGL